MDSSNMDISDMSDEDTYIFSVPYYKNESDLHQLISEASIFRRNMCHCNNNNPYTCVKWNEDTCLNCQPKDSKESARKFRRSYSNKKWVDHHNFVKTIPESLLPGGSRFSDIKIDTTYLEKVAGTGLAECWPRNINDVDCYWQLPNDYAIRRKYSYSFFKYLSSKILKTRKKLQLYSSPTQRNTEKVFETSDSLSNKFKETQIRSRINPLNMERELSREWEAGQFYPKNEFVEVNDFIERVEEEEDTHAEEQADSDVFATIKLSDPIKSMRCPRFLEGRMCSRSCRLVHRFPKEDGVVCKHFNTKLGCSRDPCPYLHNTEERVNTVIAIVRTFCSDPYSDDRCIAMLKGGICSGKRCDKLHRYPKDDGVYCQYYLTTSCRYGPKCTFLHEKVDEAHLEHAGNADLDINILSRASVKTEDETFSPAKNNSYEDSMALSSNDVSTALNYDKNERLGELSTLNDVLRGLSEVSSNDSCDERSDDSDDERPRYSGVGSMLPIFKAKRANQNKSEAKSTLRTSNTATLDNTFGNENYKNSLLVNSGNIAEGSTVDKNSCEILNNTVERKAESCNGLNDDDSDNERPRYSGIVDALSLFRGKKAEQNRKKVEKNPRTLNGRNSESTPKSKCISGNRNISETLHNIPVDASDNYIGSDHEQPMCSGVKKQTNTDEDSRSSDDTVIFSNYSKSEEKPVKFSNMGGIFPAFQKNKAQKSSGVGSMLPIFKAKRANQNKSEAKSTLRTSNTATLDNTFGNENYKNSLLVNSGNIAEGSTVDKNSCEILNNTVERKAESCNGLDDDDSDNERPRYSGIADALSLFRGKKAEQNRKNVEKNPRTLNGRNSESTPKSKCISGNRNISETLHNIPVDASDSYIGSDHEQPMCSGVKKQTNTDEDSRSSDDTVIFSNYSESEEKPVKFSNMGGIFPAFQKNKAQKSVQISESKNRKNSHTIQSSEQRNRIQSDSSRQKFDDLNTIGNYSFHTNDKSKSTKILGYEKRQTKLIYNESLRSPPGDNNRYLKQSSHERNFPKGFISFQSDEIKNVVPSLSEPPKGKATSKEPEMDIKSNWSSKKISAPTPKTSAVEKPSDSNISNNSTSSNKRKVHYDDMENVTLFHPKSSHTKHASLESMKNFKIPKIPSKQKENVTKNSNPNRTPHSEEKSKNITKLPEAVAKDFKLGCNPNKKELSHIRDETGGGIKPCIVLLEKGKFVEQKDKKNSINHKNINKQKTPFNHDVYDSQLSGKSKTDLTLSENDRKRKQIEFQSKDNYHDINITKIKKSRDEPSFPLEGPSHFKSEISSNTDKQLVFEPNTSSMEVNNKSTQLYEQRSPKRLKFENDLSKADISTPERSVDSHSKKLGKHDLSQAKSSSKLSEDANHKNIGLRKNDSALAKPSSFTLFEDSNPKLIRKDDLSQVKSSSSKSSENNNSKDNRKNYPPTSTSKLSENVSLEHAKKCDFLQTKPSSKTSSDNNPKHIKDDLLQTKLPSKQSVGSCHDTINGKHSSSKTNLSELEAASHSNKEPIKKEYDNSDDIIEITSIKLENVVPQKSVVSVSKAEDSAASGSKGVMKEVASGKCDKSCRKRTSSIRKLKDVTSPVVEKDQILIDKKGKFNSEQITKSTEDINTKTMKLNESFKIKEEPRIASEKLLNQPLKNSTRCPTSTEKNVSPNSPSDNNLNKKGRIVSEADNVHGNQNRKNQSSSDSGEENVPPSGPSELESDNYDEIFITGEIFNNGRNFIINTAADFLRNFGIKFDRTNIYQRFIELCSSYQIDEFEKDLSLPALDRNIRRFATALLHRKHYLDSNSSSIKFDIPLSEYLETLQRLDSIFASSSVNSV